MFAAVKDAKLGPSEKAILEDAEAERQRREAEDRQRARWVEEQREQALRDRARAEVLAEQQAQLDAAVAARVESLRQADLT